MTHLKFSGGVVNEILSIYLFVKLSPFLLHIKVDLGVELCEIRVRCTLEVTIWYV